MKEIYQSLVAVEPFTLVVTILNLFLQLYLIKKFLLDKVLAVLEQRRQEADRQIAEAKDAREEALAMKKTYEDNMQQAKEKAGELLRQAQKTAAARSEDLLRQAQQQATHLKQKAADDIAQEKKKAVNDAKNEIADMTLAIAGKVVGRSLDEADQSRLVDQFIDGLGEGL